jgi:hypothetical protein
LVCGKLTRIARCTIAVGVLALAFTAATASAGPLQTGFLDPGASSRGGDFEIPAGVAMQRSAEAGSKIVRLYLYWRAVSPQKPAVISNDTDPKYNWNAHHLENSVAEAANNGLTVMLTIRSAPDWAQRGGHDGGGTHNPDPALLKQFTRAAVKHFPQVRYWGVWNEPNYRSFLSPQYKRGKLVSPRMYRALLNAAASVIHDDNPANKVVAGETAPFSHWNSKGRPTAPGPLLFLRKLLCVDRSGHATCKTNVHADIFATHPYTSGNPYHHAFSRNDVSFGDLPEWKRLVNGAAKAKHITNRSGGHGVGFWITEFSWDSKPIDPKAVPKNLHARWTAEALYRTWKLGIGTLLWGQLRDYEISTDKTFGQYQSGLFYCDATPTLKDSCPSYQNPSSSTAKPSLRAFRFPFVAYASHGRIKVWGRTWNSAGGSVKIQRLKDGKWVAMKGASAASSGIFKKGFRSSVRKAKLRAAFGGATSVPFSLARPKDRFVNPFGCGGAIPC